MGKRKESEDSLTMDADGQIPSKKHKKHKHKKHKKKRSETDGNASDLNKTAPSDRSGTPHSPAQMRSNGSGTGSSTAGGGGVGSSAQAQSGVSPKANNKKRKGKGRDSGTSSDEERWLDAIQSGKLEEVDDELKKIKPKDPKLMTARQRAMLERKGDAVPDPGAEQLLALPTGYREKVMTPEMIKKAAIKSQKRKQLLDEKREKDKKRTMERLLRKQDNKTAKQSTKKSIRKAGVSISYCNSKEGISLSLPPGMEFPLEKQYEVDPPKPVLCDIKGCTNLKRYSCSKTGTPLCSLSCYKANLSRLKVKPIC